MTPTDKRLVESAKSDVESALRILGDAASRGTRSKPTVRELNDVLDRLRNAAVFLAVVIQD